MTRPADPLVVALRALYYLAILLAILVIASRRMGIHPKFIYQGF